MDMNLCTRCWTLSLVILALAAGGAFGWTNPMDSTLSGTLGTISLHAEANLSTLWTYTYVLNTTGANRPVTTFSVGDLYRLAFTNATNNGGFTDPVYNPIDPNQDSVLWTLGNVPAGQIVTFSFQSVYSHADTAVSARGSGRSAGGETIGFVPEPATLVALGGSALGVVGVLIRRRKIR